MNAIEHEIAAANESIGTCRDVLNRFRAVRSCEGGCHKHFTNALSRLERSFADMSELVRRVESRYHEEKAEMSGTMRDAQADRDHARAESDAARD